MHEASIELIPHPTIGVRRILVLVNLRILSYLGGPYTQIVVGHLESDAALSQIHKKLKDVFEWKECSYSHSQLKAYTKLEDWIIEEI